MPRGWRDKNYRVGKRIQADVHKTHFRMGDREPRVLDNTKGPCWTAKGNRAKEVCVYCHFFPAFLAHQNCSQLICIKGSMTSL